MSKCPNKHNRLYMEARTMEEGLAEAIDEGRIGPRDDSKVHAVDDAYGTAFNFIFRSGGISEVVAMNHTGRENPNGKQVFFATTTRRDVGGDGGGGGVLATTLLDHQSINHILFNNFLGGNCSTNQRKSGIEYMMNQFMSNHHQQHSISSQSSGFASLLSEYLSNLIHQQRDEIEHYLQVQEEELRRKLAEKRRQHYFVLIILC
ncbi:hypothetical protein Ccrd_018602 [Cynara cardunculus var. scolymus]|uniref:Uncharacterized protein n=1 Tax=Cynara cardunculus var. scolymus TaxID=59895 RepID=A0A103Y5X1_CYNCS|nr:hypothetical protein Ccrd_018602 [Cynara cardunculus var. scolymus]